MKNFWIDDIIMKILSVALTKWMKINTDSWKVIVEHFLSENADNSGPWEGTKQK